MKMVLFVCVHNSSRSQMAEALFNQMAKAKTIAISAGTKPASRVNPIVTEAMREVGIDISHQKPKLLTLEMLEKARPCYHYGLRCIRNLPGQLRPHRGLGA